MVITINEGNKDKINLDKKIKDDYVVLDGLRGYTVDGIEFSYNKTQGGDDQGEGMLLLKNCKNCTISNCTFRDKDTRGNFITILGKDSDRNVIDHCEFRNHTFSEDNGGEPIRIGNSNFSSCSFNTIIQFCYFHNLTADEETVSIKTCGNILQNNRHENCKSSFTIRHGGSNTIKDNVFIGYGGIRVYGDGNHITGNVHLNNNYLQFKDEKDNGKYKPPLTISNGNLENDINYSGESTPGGEPGCSHSVYARVKNNVIKGNTYYNCEGTCIVWGNKKYVCEKDCDKECGDKKYTLKGPMPPSKNTLINNLIVVDEGHGNSTLVEFNADVTPEAAKSDNTFEYNKYYNAKLGEIPQKQDEDKLTTKPEIQIPDVWRPVQLEKLIS